MTPLQLLRQSVEEAREAVRASLPGDCLSNDIVRKTLIGMCAVVSVETSRRLKLAGRNPSIEYRLSLFPMVHHFWVSCDGYVIDGTAWQLGGGQVRGKAPLVYLSRKRDARFFWYRPEKTFKTHRGVTTLIRKLGWKGPAAALLVHKEAA